MKEETKIKIKKLFAIPHFPPDKPVQKLSIDISKYIKNNKKNLKIIWEKSWTGEMKLYPTSIKDNTIQIEINRNSKGGPVYSYAHAEWFGKNAPIEFSYHGKATYQNKTYLLDESTIINICKSLNFKLMRWG